ncbi:MAG: DNA polymerase [Selenomonadaceae bacterium]|nr:DNA polymerase [Selenomonadaceae bacterium]
MRTLAIDLETFCELDIKKVGTYKYAENCEILICAYAFDDEPVKVIDIACGEQFPTDFVQALFDADVLKTAYNAPFEMQVLGKYFNKAMDTSQWACTMVLGLSLGLPAGLEQIGRVLGFAENKRKLATGTRLINFFSKPRTAPTLIRGLFGDVIQNRNLPQHNTEKWKQFKEYCRQDVETERAVRDRLALFVPPESERKLWQLDQQINSNGVLIDMTLVDGALAIDSAIREDALLQGKNLTGGRNINSNAQMLDWIEDKEGWRPASLDKESREELKGDTLTSEVQEFLQLKEVLAKTSVKKYQAMKDTACSDGRARGMFQFYGANRTGRWAGRHIQLQNLPQNHLDDLDIARTYVRKADAIALDLFYENPSNVLSQLIRTAFIAAEGCRFIVADFSAIEARVIAWLANEKWRMEVFANGGDIYCASASEMFKVPVEKHGVNKELRAKGKIAELACGYSGGVSALKAFGADKMGLTDSEMESIIKKWRESSPNICKLWRDVENAAKRAIKTAKKILLPNNIGFRLETDFLFIKLPSGREIAYYKPAVVNEDDERECITYEGSIQAAGGWGTNRTWGGKLVENIVQATARDCLAAAMLRIDAAGYKIVMHVHDEIICEMPYGKGSLEEVISIMSKPLNWAKELLLTADGYETEYYKKD